MSSELNRVDAALAGGLAGGNNGSHTAEVAGIAIEHHRRIVIAFVGMAFEARD